MSREVQIAKVHLVCALFLKVQKEVSAHKDDDDDDYATPPKASKSSSISKALGCREPTSAALVYIISKFLTKLVESV